VRSGSGKDLVARAIKNVIRWAMTTRDGDDSGDCPKLQVGYLGKIGDAAAWFPYGLHANVPAGELAVMFAMNGNPESRVVLPGSVKSRPHPLAVGEVVLYHPGTGAMVHLKANGDVLVSSPGNVSIEAAGDVTATAAGDVTATAAGNATITAGGVAAIDAPDIQAAIGATSRLLNETALATYNDHTHPGGGGNPADPQMVPGVDTTVILKGS